MEAWNKYNQEEAKLKFMEYGFTLYDVYRGSGIPIGLICPRGHKTKVSLDNIRGVYKRKKGEVFCCKDCKKEDHAIFIKEKIQAVEQKKNIECVDKKGCVSVHKKVLWECKKGHIYLAKIAHLQLSTTNMCPECCENKYIKNRQYYVDKFVSIYGDIYDYSLFDFIDTHHKIKVICKEHGIFERDICQHLYGYGCPKCARRKIGKESRSKNEILCYGKIKELLGQDCKIENNVTPDELRKKGRGGRSLGVDIEIQSKNSSCFIEWNGVYYHSDDRTKRNDAIKKKIMGDKLIQIVDPGMFDENFVNEIIKEKIIPFLKDRKII